MKKLWMVGLLLGGCFEGGADTDTTNLAQNGGETEDPANSPTGMERYPDGTRPGDPNDACIDLRWQIDACFQEAGQGDCAAASEAQGACYAAGYEACLGFERAVKDCLGVRAPDGQMDGQPSGEGCEQELAALDACYANISPPDCTQEDEAVATCYARCEQLIIALDQACPPPPPPPGPEGYCLHLREALALCDAEHGGQNTMDPAGLNGEYVCAPILAAFEQLCLTEPEPCPNGR